LPISLSAACASFCKLFSKSISLSDPDADHVGSGIQAGSGSEHIILDPEIFRNKTFYVKIIIYVAMGAVLLERVVLLERAVI